MPDHPRRGSLLVIFLTVFIDLLGFGMVLPLLPLYAKQIAGAGGLDPGSKTVGLIIGLLMSSFSLMQFLCAPIWGRLSDRIGRRPVLLIGLAGSVFFYGMFAIATVQASLLWLFVSRIGAGIAGANISTAQAYIADSTSLETRSKGMALIGAAFGLGFTFGPLIGFIGIREDQLSAWPGWTASSLSAVALLLGVFLLPESLASRMAHAARRMSRWRAFLDAISVPSVGMLIAASFVSVLSFANFESTLSLLLAADRQRGGFSFQFGKVLLVFAFIGFVLTFAQGFLVRRLAVRVADNMLAIAGAVVSIGGFLLLGTASAMTSLELLFVGLAVEVIGFAFLTPMLNALISRRSDPSKQGGILGVSQSATSLARILGPVMGNSLFPLRTALPYWAAAGMMVLGTVLVVQAARSGRDFDPGLVTET